LEAGLVGPLGPPGLRIRAASIVVALVDVELILSVLSFLTAGGDRGTSKGEW
jgi:hypothetical protein